MEVEEVKSHPVEGEKKFLTAAEAREGTSAKLCPIDDLARKRLNEMNEYILCIEGMIRTGMKSGLMCIRVTIDDSQPKKYVLPFLVDHFVKTGFRVGVFHTNDASVNLMISWRTIDPNLHTKNQ